MDLIDRYAHSNAIRCLDPAHKGALALLAMGLCLTLDSPLVGAVSIAWMLGLSVLWARVPAHVVGRVMLGQGLFLAASSAGVAVSVAAGAPGEGSWAIQAGPLWLSSSPAALAAALGLAARALGCAAALSFLILSTPLLDLIELLRRLRAPEALIDLMTLTYRAIFVLLESLGGALGARGAAGGAGGKRGALGSAAQLASQLLVDTIRRSRRLQLSAERPGSAELPISYSRGACAWWLGAAMATTMLLAGLI